MLSIESDSQEQFVLRCASCYGATSKKMITLYVGSSVGVVRYQTGKSMVGILIVFEIIVWQLLDRTRDGFFEIGVEFVIEIMFKDFRLLMVNWTGHGFEPELRGLRFYRCYARTDGSIVDIWIYPISKRIGAM